jgi:predicted Zn-dependent protease
MRRLLAIAVSVLVLWGCANGRGRRADIGGESDWLVWKNRQRIVSDPIFLDPVLRVANRLYDAAEQDPELAEQVRQFRWRITLIDDPAEANAFTSSDGHIVLLTGMLAPARTEAGLAAVIGHEMAHVLRGSVTASWSWQRRCSVRSPASRLAWAGVRRQQGRRPWPSVRWAPMASFSR